MFDSPAFPDPLLVDPWWDLFVPATFGEADVVLDTLEAGEASTPPDQRGDLYAVAARAFAVLGRVIEAERLVERAILAGGVEADALATFVRPDGMARAQARMLGGGRAGHRADAACDRAALLLIAGRVDEARLSVRQGASICPGHAEAQHWERFFADTPDPAAAVRAAREARPNRRSRVPGAEDVRLLLPTRRAGWMSPERYARRVLGAPPTSGWAPSGSSLGRLQDAGASTCYFAMDAEHGRLEGTHPLTELELLADALRSRVEEGRDAQVEARAFWDRATEVDEEAMADAAHVLSGLGTTDPRLALVALEAVTWLATERPEHALLWEGYLSLLGHHAGVDTAVERARALLTRRPVEPTAWRMAVEVLRLRGFAEEVDRIARQARGEPSLSAMAVELLDGVEPPPFRMVVSGRIAPRWPLPSRQAARKRAATVAMA